MKKFFVVFAFFAALVFVTSCGGGSKTDDRTDTGEDVSDEDVADEDVTDEDTVDTASADNPDSENPDTIPDSGDFQTDDSDTMQDDADLTDDNADSADDDADSADDSDTDPVQANPCDGNPCAGIMYSTGACTVTNGGYACGCYDHYSWTGSVCKAESRVVDCTGLPANAQWNTAESVSQTWNGEEWYPPETGTYDTNPSSSECIFKCNSDYDWNGTECWRPVDPCDPNPCSGILNANGECLATGDTTYVCKCSPGFNWTGTSCSALPECSTSNTGPCYDSTTNLTWSAKADAIYAWSDSVSYCDGLKEGGPDWRLPTISELRTLIQKCLFTVTGGSCRVVDTGDSSTSCLSHDSCWTEGDCFSCSADSTEGDSKFGDTGWFWSSSVLSDDSNLAWCACFDNGGVSYDTLEFSYSVRCVR